MQLSEKNNDYYTKMNEMLKNIKLIKNQEIRIVIDTNENHDCILYLDKKIEDWNTVIRSLKNIIREKTNKCNLDIGSILREKKYNFVFSKVLNCKLNNEDFERKTYSSIMKKIYMLINDPEKIQKYTLRNFVKGKKLNNGFKYIEDLDISVQDIDSINAIKEIIQQSMFNNLNLEIKIKLSKEHNKEYNNDKEIEVCINCNNGKFIISDNIEYSEEPEIKDDICDKKIKIKSKKNKNIIVDKEMLKNK